MQENSTPGNPKRSRGRPPKKHQRPKKLKNLVTAEEKNGAISVLLQQGMSLRDISAAVGASTFTVANGGFTTPAKRTTGVARDSPEDVVDRRERVEELHREDQKRTSEDIRWILAGEGTFVSKRTIARDHKALGGKHLTCERVPRLNEKQIEYRFAWAKEMLKKPDTFFEQLVFSDESKRGTSDMDQTAWVLPGEQRAVREEARWDAKIHVWAYIGKDGVRCIRRVDGHTITAEFYLELLKSTVGKRQWKTARVFQQDNAPAHTAKVVKEWLRTNLNFLEGWPPNSPDLSPIENLWGRLWADAMKLRPRDADELWSCVETVFNRFSDDYVNDLVMSFRRRLTLVVERKGESIGDEY